MSDCTIVCDCKIAEHKHGTRAMYTKHECRGTACREASRVYEANRRRARAYGIEADRVDAQPVRDHVEYLRDNGVSYKALSKACGVGRSTIQNMLFGRKDRGHAPYARVARSTAEKILAVKPSLENMSAGRPVDATGTRRRLQALVTIGYSITSLGERLGVSPGNMSEMMQRELVTVATVRKVRALYSELWDKPNQPTQWRKLSAANRARNYASIHGWLPPMAWDDELIDDPNHVPGVPEPELSKVSRRREAFLEEVEFFAAGGDQIETIAEALGLSADAVEKRLERYERADLISKIGTAPKRNYSRKAAA